jgi:hypothetical protein
LTRATLIRKIGAPPPPTQLILADQDAYDIIARMMLKHKNCACDYSKIANDFDAQDVEAVAEKLFDFCKKNLQYREEKISKQYVSSPQTILERGYCDCKGYALFCGGVLDALNRKGWNIKWVYRFASDDTDTEIPGHVFIVINDNGNEIWLDPVLNYFNQNHYYPYYQDKKVSARVAGCGCPGHIGATTAQTGQTIMKLAPALAVVPVVGWIGGAAAEIVGGIVSIVGSKWNQSPDVRWLIQLYEYYALGKASVTSDSKILTENDTQPAQAFFSVVLGVPIGGRKDFNILQSGDGNTNTPTTQTAAQRAQNYLIWKGLQNSAVTIDMATAAANIAATMNPNGVPAGGWSTRVPAPSTIDQTAATSPNFIVNGAGQLIDTLTGQPATNSNETILLVAAAAIALIFIL